MSKEELTCKTPNNKILVSNSFDENCLIWINSKVMCISETINKLEQQVKRQKEVIDKAINWTIKYQTECCQEDEVIRDLKRLLDILKGEQNG